MKISIVHDDGTETMIGEIKQSSIESREKTAETGKVHSLVFQEREDGSTKIRSVSTDVN